MDTNTGRYAIFRQLLADGIDVIFGNPGSSEQNLIDAMQVFPEMRYILGLQEGSVVAMADSFARARQRPAFVQLHSYAGLANGLGMMYFARRGYTPMVVIVGEAGLKYEALDGQMAADLVNMARPFVKSDANGPCAWRVVDPDSTLRLVRRALKAAATPPMGPVLLVLPMDVLDLPNTEPVIPSTHIETRVTPDAETIQRAAHLLSNAQRPLILMGDGISAAGAQAELAQVAEILGAVVWGANCSEVNMPASHPLFGGLTGHMFGEDSKRITAEADAVLICGTTVLPEVFPALEGVFAPEAPLIHFDLNTYEIGKNFPVTLGALGDPKCTLALLAEALSSMLSTERQALSTARYRQRMEAKHQEQIRCKDADARVRDQVPIRASRFMEELAEKLPKDALLFDEALTTSPELCRYLPQETPGSYFQTRAGMLGTGLPGTIGLKLAHPARTVVGFSGDGGSISTIQALWTAAHHKIGAKFVICNNRSYRILKYNLQQYWQTLGLPKDQAFPIEFDLNTPDLRFDQLATGLGVRAVRVERPEEIAPALEQAFADDQPFLIDLILDSAT